MITDFIYLKLVFSSCKYTSTFLESYMLYITKLMQTWSLCSPVAMYLWNQMPKQTQNSFNITAALTSQQTLQGIHDILCKCFTYLRGVWAHATCPVNSYRLANTITIYMIASTWSKVHMAGIILRLVAGSMRMWCIVGDPENRGHDWPARTPVQPWTSGGPPRVGCSDVCTVLWRPKHPLWANSATVQAG